MIIKLEEYEVIEDLANGVFKATRHGEEWRNLAGDNLILVLVSKIEKLESDKDELIDTLRDITSSVVHHVQSDEIASRNPNYNPNQKVE